MSDRYDEGSVRAKEGDAAEDAVLHALLDEGAVAASVKDILGAFWSPLLGRMLGDIFVLGNRGVVCVEVTKTNDNDSPASMDYKKCAFNGSNCWHAHVVWCPKKGRITRLSFVSGSVMKAYLDKCTLHHTRSDGSKWEHYQIPMSTWAKFRAGKSLAQFLSSI